ncbi:MAG: DNA polymerase III subunit epsilon [Gammaproteobacteria bacterium]
MRQIVLDTETTGLEPSAGHRVIEIGCVEILDRRITSNRYHQYINPEREIDQGAVEVHGLTTEFLSSKPRFAEVVDDFVAFVRGAELIIHNAPFDVGFIDAELGLLEGDWEKTADYCGIFDTLSLAREMHPGQRNSLDALCRRYEVDNRHRDLHGALLDAELLADVYLLMTGGQVDLTLHSAKDRNKQSGAAISKARAGVPPAQLKIVKATPEEAEAHAEMLELIDRESGGGCLWLQQE